MTTIRSAGRGTTRLGVLALASGAALVLPSVAFGAGAGATTIRATIGSDGTVSSVQQIAGDGTSSAFGDKMPITLAISHGGSGSQQSYTYHVENTFTQTQTVHYDDTAGNPHHTSLQLQLPLVAQLSVDVPASLKDVTAAGATVSSSSDGARHLLWTMVLFTPLGSAAQDVTFTAVGSGSPTAELRAAAVNPTTTPGLSNASQSASAGYQQDDFWAGYASGANDGLKKLYSGSGDLSDGLGQAQDGANQLADGLASALTGTKQAADGSTQLYDGSQQLTDGLAQARDGADQLVAGLGSDKQAKSVLGGLKAISDGLSALNVAFAGDGTAANPGITFGMACAVDGIDLIVKGNATPVADHCFDTLGGYKPVLPALSTVPGATMYNTLLSTLLSQALIPLNDGIAQEVAPGIEQLAAGADQLHTALKGQFAPGLAQLDDGLAQLQDGSTQVRDGLQQLSSGLVDGAKQFPAAVDGAQQLASGLTDAADGSKQIHDGIGQVKDQATGPLQKQLQTASINGHKQLAVLNAAANLAASGPGGEGATYVLSQRSSDVALAASSTPAGSSHTARNVGIGVGGFVLLLLGLGSGFALGRQRRQTVA